MEGDMVTTCISLHIAEGTFILVRVYWNLNVLGSFPKIIRYRISWISFRWEPNCSMLADGRTDRQIWRS